MQDEPNFINVIFKHNVKRSSAEEYVESLGYEILGRTLTGRGNYRLSIRVPEDVCAQQKIVDEFKKCRFIRYVSPVAQ